MSLFQPLSFPWREIFNTRLDPTVCRGLEHIGVEVHNCTLETPLMEYAHILLVDCKDLDIFSDVVFILRKKRGFTRILNGSKSRR